MTQSTAFQVGDTVQVELPAGWFTGKVQAVKPRFLWTEETYLQISGDIPERFITTCKAKNVERA